MSDRGATMPATTQPRWPVVVCLSTVVAGLLSTAATSLYYEYTSQVEQDEKSVAELISNYEKEVSAMRRELGAMQTRVIQEPITRYEENCTRYVPLVPQVCTKVPVVEYRSRTIDVPATPATSELEGRISMKLKAIEKLNQVAQRTRSKQMSLSEIVAVSRQMVAPLLSVAVTIACLIVILSRRYQSESEKWAFGALGTILGFWLK